MPENTRDRLIRYLNDAYAMEKGGVVALEDIGERAVDPEVRRVARQLAMIARSQADRVAQRVRELGGKVAANKAAVNSVMASGNRLTNALHDKADKQTQDVGKAYAVSAFEESMYVALCEYAGAIGDDVTAELGAAIAAEQRAACAQLYALVPRLAVVPAERAARGNGGADTGGALPAGVAIPAVVLGSAALTYFGLNLLRGGGQAGRVPGGVTRFRAVPTTTPVRSGGMRLVPEGSVTTTAPSAEVRIERETPAADGGYGTATTTSAGGGTVGASGVARTET